MKMNTFGKIAAVALAGAFLSMPLYSDKKTDLNKNGLGKTEKNMTNILDGNYSYILGARAEFAKLREKFECLSGDIHRVGWRISEKADSCLGNGLSVPDSLAEKMRVYSNDGHMLDFIETGIATLEKMQAEIDSLKWNATFDGTYDRTCANIEKIQMKLELLREQLEKTLLNLEKDRNYLNSKVYGEFKLPGPSEIPKTNGSSEAEGTK